MLSDEEKEIFNNLKDYMQSNIDNGYHKFIYNDLGWDFKCIDCINAIDKVLKQSKEIEELKDKNKPQPDCVEPVEKIEEMVNMRWVNHRFISKDKIKEILGIEETDSEKILSLLQTIVDENARLEDIEDKKVQIEYNNVFNKGVKSVEDKIKAKIEEIEKEIKVKREIAKNPMDRVSGRLLTDSIVELEKTKKVLQSLLEKE